MPSTVRVLLAAALFLLLTPGPSPAENACAAAKLKAACKDAGCQAALEAKEAQSGAAVDPEKIAKCQANLAKAFGKSEQKGGCLTPGDAAGIEGKVGAFVLDLQTALDVATGTNPNKCEGAKIKAAAKKLACKCALEAKQAQKGGAIDLVKFTKCETAFDASFTKSEEKGGCNTTGDTAAIEAKVDAFLADLDASLPWDPSGCIPSNGGAESCDGLDNDCDGTADDGFDKLSDPQYCANCAGCSLPNAVPGCSAGACTVAGCVAGWIDLNGLAGDGCEHACTPSGPEICDGEDNDCDGTIDDGNPGGGGTCGTDTGQCSAGTEVCTDGALDCVGAVEPTSETCNNLDDDCNGVVDNGFNKLTDPQYCANCAGCNLPNAVPGCSGGNCTVAGCQAGWVNLNGVIADGCEYQCTPTGPEVCDGVDNNCNGLIDAADPFMFASPNFCKTQGECAGMTPTCTGPGGWDCIYTDPDIELDGNGDVVAEETRCDQLDNDCDGSPDEPFPLKGTACVEDGTFGTTRRLGVCRGSGTLVCNAANTDLRCNVTVGGGVAASETCNGLDDDCDGHVDEPYDHTGLLGVRDATVGPVTINGQSVVMYRYEASRPDATLASAGTTETRACSVAGRRPWAAGDFTEAQAACASAGMRLCRVTRDGSGVVTSDEWGRFCEGASNRTFPYGNVYNATACNGADYDPVPGGANDDVAITTGSLATCEAQDLSRDQSGNLREWVEDPRTVGSDTVHTLRGGAFNSPQADLDCDDDLTTALPTYAAADAGFRCCGRACAAGQIDCGGTCVNAATSGTNCGGCGIVCGAGDACSNGYCCPTGTRACGDVCTPNATPCP